MIQIHGLWWPDDVGDKYKHALKHVRSLEWAIAACRSRRTAVQAGGNVGLWPRRLADAFARVITFEPEPVSRDCLTRNVAGRAVVIHACAVGQYSGQCQISRKSLGSHRIVETIGTIPMMTVDSLGLNDVDFLQLDVEGYEWHALMGAADTVLASRPLIQVELREFGSHFGKSDHEVRALLASWGYHEVSRQPGSDVVFRWAA